MRHSSLLRSSLFKAPIHRQFQSFSRYSLGSNQSQTGNRLNALLPKQFTLHVEHPEKTSQEDILECCRHHSQSIHGFQTIPEKPTIVVLATPSFSPWLEAGAGFIDRLVGKFTGASEWAANVPHEIDVVCACVDGVSPVPGSIPSFEGELSNQGLSFLYGPRDLIIPSWIEDSNSPITNSSLQSSITLSRNSVSTSFNITVPLANTLFKNGRHSTLLISKWQEDSAKIFKRVEGPLERNNLTLQILQGEEDENPTPYIPSVSLTPARRIVSGLGNIVRQVDFGNDSIGPASQELEECVTRDLANRPGTKLDIWALIVPQNVISKLDGTNYALQMDDQQCLQRKKEENGPDHRYIGNWLAHGATFCRVLSGGGGWGAKQGLLSLDPQTTYSSIDDARFDFSEESIADQQASALGRLAKEGDYIQFFTTEKNIRIPETNTTLEQGKNSIVIGAISSTRDHMPTFHEEGSPETETSNHLPHVQIGHFGCVSESGIFLERLDAKSRKFVTKIDLPHSYFFS